MVMVVVVGVVDDDHVDADGQVTWFWFSDTETDRDGDDVESLLCLWILVDGEERQSLGVETIGTKSRVAQMANAVRKAM